MGEGSEAGSKRYSPREEVIDARIFIILQKISDDSYPAAFFTPVDERLFEDLQEKGAGAGKTCSDFDPG